MSCKHDNSMYTTIPPEEDCCLDDDVVCPEKEDYQMIEKILFSDEINEEEIRKRGEETGVFNVSVEEILDFSKAAINGGYRNEF